MLKTLLKKQLLEINRGFFYDQKKGPATALSVVGFLILCVVAGLYMMISLRKEDQA